jgi:ACS family hexuronate transporter-like MFS transporter
MLQPLCGYVLDTLGLKYRLRDLRRRLVADRHGPRPGHQLADASLLRGLLGTGRGLAQPAGMKAVSEWFPAKERGIAGGIFNIGASIGSVLAPPLVVWAVLPGTGARPSWSTGALGLVWVVLWLPSTLARQASAADRRRARADRRRPGGAPDRAGTKRPSIVSILKQRNFWGIALPRFLADPTWGTLSFWVPLYLTRRCGFDLKQIALFAWMPFVAADLGCLFGPSSCCGCRSVACR